MSEYQNTDKPDTPKSPTVYNAREAAAYVGVPYTSFLKNMHLGKIPYTEPLPRRYRWTKAMLDELLSAKINQAEKSA